MRGKARARKRAREKEESDMLEGKEERLVIQWRVDLTGE